MQNDIIKNSSAKNINEEKEEINKKQLEESQKKNIQEKTSVEKLVDDTERNENSASSHISLRDYSKKIRYDEIQGNSTTEDTSSVSENSYTQSAINAYFHKTPEEKISYNGNVSSKDSFSYNDISSKKIINDRGNTENIIKTNDNTGGLIRTNDSSIIKDTQNTVKSENKKISNTARPNRLKDAYKERVNRNNGISENISDNRQYQDNNYGYQSQSNFDNYTDNQQYQSDNYSYQSKQNFDSHANNQRIYSDNDHSKSYSYNDSENMPDAVYPSNESNQAFNYIDRNNDITVKSNKSDIDYRQINVDVRPEISQVLNSETTKVEKSKIDDIVRKNRLKSAYQSIEESKQNQNNDYESFKYHDDTYADQTVNYTDNYLENQSIKYVDDTYLNQDIRYIDESVSDLKENGIILNENRIDDIINSDISKTDDLINEKSESKLKEAVKRKNRLEKLGIKEQESKLIRDKNKSDIIKENESLEKSVTDKEINNQYADIATISNTSLENSKSKQSSNKDTFFSEKTDGKKRNLNLNKADISKKAEMLGIKKESADSIKESIMQYNKDTKKSAISVTSFAKRGIRNMIAENNDDDIVLQGVNTAVKSYESGIVIYRSSAKVADLGREIVTTPKEIYKSSKIIKSRLRKTQKFMRMSRANKLRYTKVYVKTAINNTVTYITDTAVKTTKSLAVKVIGAGFAALLLIIVISSAVLIILTSFMWQTTSDLDTTQMVKYIAELDYDEQKKWFTQGKTNVEIADSNERGSKRSTPMSYEYHYLLAVDVPPEVGVEENVVSTGAIKCSYSTGFDSSGKKLPVSYSGFNKEFRASDAMLEEYRWTTDDYFAALAYLQVKNDNLGWFTSLFGWVGKAVLKSSMDDLHEATYKQEIVHKETKNGNSEYSFDTPICSTTYTDTNNTKSYYFGRKYSVKYLIDNDMIRFDDDDEENKKQKEQFERVYRYGNIAVSNLAPPLELEDGEDISDRIVKHFGKQLYLTYEPPEPPSDPHDRVFGSISKHTGYHYAIDLKADSGDIILAPISGLCKARQRDGRGYEYSICTALNDDGTDFDFTKKGYLVKISCSSASFIPTSVPMKVNKGSTWLGYVGSSSDMSVNYTIPDMDNDTENEDIFAKQLFPCFTGTNFQSIEDNEYDLPDTQYDHIHMEMYKLPCDFNDRNDIEKNVLDPELFFERQAEDE